MLLCWACVGSAYANDLIVKREVFSDIQGQLNIETVQHQPFKPINNLLIAGYTPATQWMRITIRPTSKAYIELRIRPTYLDEITLYSPDPQRPGQWLEKVTGDRYAYQGRDRHNAITHGFVIAGHNVPTVYYLKLRTTSTSLMHVEALPDDEASLKEMRQHIIVVLYLAIMLWLGFWSANDFISKPQLLTGLFTFYQLAHILYALAILGYLAPWTPIDQLALNDTLTSIAILTIVFISILFHYVLLSQYKPNRWGMRILLCLAALFPVLLCGLVTGFTQEALKYNAYLVVLSTALLFPLALSASAEEKDIAPSRKTLRIIYGLHSLSLIVSILPVMGWSPAAEWNLNAILGHSVISAFLMYIILQQRSSASLRESNNAKLSLRLANQELALERQKRDEMGYFMAMITHELKTPLSVIRLSLDALSITGQPKRHIEQSISDISNMIDRCAQISKIEEKNIKINYEACDLAGILQSLVTEYDCIERVELSIHIMTPLRCDHLMLRLILRNLLENALKYSPANSAISIRINAQTENDGRSGIAISVENSVDSTPDLIRIFDKYYREAQSSKHTGFGLGLYLSRAVALSLNGSLNASLYHHRIRFTLWLPS
ncbi:7TM-DISM domain-containing protein [Methylobacillus methanolivorans]|uniref:histidine kinase n=1 Tax=Methylobacillus methanolivorans TaxID=1848927 RepID=A0ABW8GMW6_9PROT